MSAGGRASEGDEGSVAVGGRTAGLTIGMTLVFVGAGEPDASGVRAGAGEPAGSRVGEAGSEGVSATCTGPAV